MKNKTQAYLAAFIAVISFQFSFGQTLPEAIRKTMNERYESAASDFRQLVQLQPTSGDVFFYAGDNGTVMFDHGQRTIYITDAKQNIWFKYNSAYFPYGSTLDVDVSCQ